MTVVVAVIPGHSEQKDGLPFSFCVLNHKTTLYSPSQACLDHCEYNKNMGAACDKHNCYCVPYGE